MKTHTFDTIMGLYDLRNQKLNQLWTVGQWQNGDFNGIAGIGVKGAKQIKLKKGW
jgi:branched-chain amino acid transport system substrate-binding protein